MKEIKITTEYIKLGQLLKFANVVTDGIDAKIMVQNGEIKVNDEVCTMRGKKLVDGDIVEVIYNGEKFIVKQ